MKQLIISLCLFMFVGALVQSCDNASKKEDTAENSQAAQDSLDACAPIKDPNNPKPMALMMRQMAANADSMKAKINRGETLDSLQYPFIRFYAVEPTDPKVLEANFFDKARLFQAAYKEVFQHPTEQKKYYNLMIQACVNCHQNYCSGPLKRIRKLPI
jgi:hypothetical protein